jgi:hypothetical protein
MEKKFKWGVVARISSSDKNTLLNAFPHPISEWMSGYTYVVTGPAIDSYYVSNNGALPQVVLDEYVFIIDHVNESLIKDIISVAADCDTTYFGEPYIYSDGEYFHSKCDLFGIRHSPKITINNILDHHGYTLKGNKLIRKEKLEDVTDAPDTCLKTDDGHYIHDEEEFYRVDSNYNIDKFMYKNGMRVYNDGRILARFKYRDAAMAWVEKNKPKPEFKPFNLTLPIKTEDDLLDLYHRINLNHVTMYEKYHSNIPIPSSSGNLWDAYSIVDRKIDELGLRK